VRSFDHLVEEAADSERSLAEDLSDSGRRWTVEELLDAVFASGDELKKAPTLERIKDYRRFVKAFVRYAVDHSLALTRTTSGANVLRRKQFTLVKVIDEKLEDLALSVLSAQGEQMAILAQIDEINGLLVDLIS
jgi:uncharacterized protein YaaR (DUF327 family)